MEVDIMEGAELNTIIARCIGYSDTHNFVGDVLEAVRLWEVMKSQLWDVTIRDCDEYSNLGDDGPNEPHVMFRRRDTMVWASGPTWLVALGRAVVKAHSS